MKYFMHDTNAHQDEKIAELFMLHGYEGTGLFFAVLEKLALHEKPVKTTVLKSQLSIGKRLEKVWSFLEQIELISSNNGETFNKNVLKFSEKYQIKKEKNKERITQWRENKAVPKPVTRNERVRNSPYKTRLDKTREEKNKKENNTTDATASEVPDFFDQFWTVYDKKVDRKKCLAKCKTLSPADIQAILENVPQYVKLHPNPNYRKSPLTYLNGENWKDPLETSTNPAPAAQDGMVY